MGLFDPGKRKPTVLAHPKPRYGVLLVDDEILNLTSLASLLEDEYQVHIASSANDALHLLANPAKAGGIHVIVSDQRMPGMTGVELLAKSRLLRPDAKRILLTGYTDIEAIVGAINEAAIWKYLRKPVESQELRLTLQRACEAWQLEQDNIGLLGELRVAFSKLSLLDADKMAFLRYLAHEMNTPLNWLSATQVIDRRQLSAETVEMLDYVDQGRDRLHGLISAVLRYFQASGMELQPQRERVDFSFLLSKCVDKAQESHGESVLLRLEQPVTLTLETDSALLTELLEHLLENAVSHAKATAAHRVPEVRLKMTELDRAVALTVFNSGDELDAEALEKLLKPFFFCGSSHGAHGFGLSLATARALALHLGGDLLTRRASDGVMLELHLPISLPIPRDTFKAVVETPPATPSEPA